MRKKRRKQHPKSPEWWIRRVYQDLDRDIADALKQRQKEHKSTPTCQKACAHCCQQAIPATLPEAKAVARYIEQKFTPAARAALQKRMATWFLWSRTEWPRLLAEGMNEGEALHRHGPPCPLLVDDVCSIYPVRPLTCRTHYVLSDPRLCMPSNTPGALEGHPVIMEGLHQVALPHAQRIRAYIEMLGLEFTEAVSLLPRWLAVELGWRSLM